MLLPTSWHAPAHQAGCPPAKLDVTSGVRIGVGFHEPAVEKRVPPDAANEGVSRR
jgi:hypothetical protein